MIIYNFMNYNNFIKGIFIFSLLVLFSCKSEYTKLVNKELASGVKNDSLLYGLKFGNTKKEFYQICWDLNSKGIVTHGGNNNYVKTILRSKDTIHKTKSLEMLFYALFNNKDIITGMNVKFSYLAWAPWNKELQSDKLLPVVKDSLLKWYPGNDFMMVKNNILVKVDGNRQIQIKKETDKDVSVLIENLQYKYKTLVD